MHGTIDYPIIDPIAVAYTSNSNILVADRSERAVRLYDADGSLVKQIIGAGLEDDQLRTMYGIALIDGTVGAFDVDRQEVLLTNTDGKLTGRIPVPESQRPGRTIRTVSDATLMLVRYPRPGESRELVSLMDITGRVRLRTMAERTYYRRMGPLLTQISMPLADYWDDILIGSYVGRNLLVAYNTTGDLVASGVLPSEIDGVILTRFDQYNEAEFPLGRSESPAFLAWWRAQNGVVASEIVGTRGGAVLQFDYGLLEGQTRRSLSDSAFFVPIVIDRAKGLIRVGHGTRMVGRLVGRNPAGDAVIARIVGKEDATIELVSLVTSGGGS